MFAERITKIRSGSPKTLVALTALILVWRAPGAATPNHTTTAGEGGTTAATTETTAAARRPPLPRRAQGLHIVACGRSTSRPGC